MRDWLIDLILLLSNKTSINFCLILNESCILCDSLFSQTPPSKTKSVDKLDLEQTPTLKLFFSESKRDSWSVWEGWGESKGKQGQIFSVTFLLTVNLNATFWVLSFRALPSKAHHCFILQIPIHGKLSFQLVSELILPGYEAPPINVRENYFSNGKNIGIGLWIQVQTDHSNFASHPVPQRKKNYSDLIVSFDFSLSFSQQSMWK